MGGNIIPSVESVKIHELSRSLSKFREILPNGIQYHIIGSAGQKSISSDVDVFIDVTDLQRVFPSDTVKDSKNKLKEHFESLGMVSKLSGVCVHVGLDIGEKIVQFDIMVLENAEKAAKLHRYDYDNDEMSGGIIQQIRADLARCLEPSLKMSPYRGLVDRETNELITDDLNEMAKIIIDDEASGYDIISLERILKSLERHPEKLEMINENYFQNV